MSLRPVTGRRWILGGISRTSSSITAVDLRLLACRISTRSLSTSVTSKYAQQPLKDGQQQPQLGTATATASKENTDVWAPGGGGMHGDGKEWFNWRPTKEDPAQQDSDDSSKVNFQIRIPKPLRPSTEDRHVRINRLHYSSRKRGILETDLLLATFATKERLQAMSDKALAEYDSLLEENDWDIYYWTTDAKQPPKDIASFEFWDDLIEHCKNKRREILRMPPPSSA